MQYYNQLPDPIKSLLSLIGLTYAGYKSLQLLSLLGKITTEQLSKKNLSKQYGKDSWAMVTGASEGMGKAFCEELAREGFNIILISRNVEKLKNAVSDLRKIREGVQTKIITADFTKSHEEGFYQYLSNEIEDFDVSIMINCVGLETMNNFEEITPQFMKDLITANTIPVVLLSRMMVKKFKNRDTSKGQRCAILNVGSVSGMRPVPFFVPYSPSKAFTDYFTTALAEEVDDTNIDILSFMPGYVQTAMTARKPLSMDTITANNCARTILNKLGNGIGSNGHWKHKVLAWKINFLPELVHTRIIKIVIRKEMNRRKAASPGH